MTEKVYKNPAMQAGNPLINSVSTSCKTPILPVKFCNLKRPFFYANSPGIARYSVTCILDPEKDKEFISAIINIEKKEGVPTLLKSDPDKDEDGEKSNKILIKFQTKDIVPVYVIGENGKPELIRLEDDLAKGEKISCVYDIIRYTKKGLKLEHGLSFKLSCVYYYPTQPLEETNYHGEG